MAHEEPGLLASLDLIRSLGFAVDEASHRPGAFGSWFIIAAAGRRVWRVAWDGRDSCLTIDAPSTSGGWNCRWIAGPGYAHKPQDLKDGLLAVLQA